ncbi:MAG: winged helix DNA-binding domain-containing protein [Nocardioides sp.]
MRHVPDIERRSRLVRRHALGPHHRLTDPVAATEAVVCLHATEPATVYLSVAARTEDVTVADLDRALYAERSLVKQLAMRRTLFAFPRDLLPAVWGSASARVAETERRKIGKDLVTAGLTGDGDAWLDAARSGVLDLLADRSALGAQEIREQYPPIDVKVSTSANAKWGGPIPVAPRVLGWLGARGEIVRGTNGGHWRTSRPRWTSMADWLGELPERRDVDSGYAELVRRWLERFGPGTETDLVWWLGGTKVAVRRALADLAAVEVSLDGGGTGWLLPDDVEPEPEVEPVAALLPVLDPTTMGWKERAFYLDPDDVSFLFDTAGNGGTTAWWDGRIVGAWVQDAQGRLEVVLRRDPGAEARAALKAEAERLSAWLDGQVIASVYKSQLMIGARLP